MSKRSIHDIGSSIKEERSSSSSKTTKSRPHEKNEWEKQDAHGKEQKDQTTSTAETRIQHLLEWLETLGGADFSNVRVGETSKGGGWGVYSKETIPPDGMIAKIPHQAIMSHQRSQQSKVGRSCLEVGRKGKLEDLPSEEFVLWLDMVHGRRDINHFHHPYLISLPTEAPDIPSWNLSEQRRRRLIGTNLGTAAEQASKELEEQFHRWMPFLKQGNPELFGWMTLSDLIWARGMYFSRRFPTVLLQDESINNQDDDDDGETKTRTPIPIEGNNGDMNKGNSSIGIMLPFFDLLNHAPHQPITWYGSKTDVTFFAGPPPHSIPAGDEIYNNYGPKGNEMLMMMYGFALPNNCHDSYGLHLVKMIQLQKTTKKDEKVDDDKDDGNTTSEDPAMEKINLGTFQIHRRDSPINPQFPPELWKALNEMFVDDDEDGRDETPLTNVDNDNDHDSDSNNDHTEDIEIGFEAIELLLETLRKRWIPFETTKEIDQQLDDDVNIYRDGQRIVLEQAIETLEEMLPEEEEMLPEEDEMG